MPLNTETWIKGIPWHGAVPEVDVRSFPNIVIINRHLVIDLCACLYTLLLSGLLIMCMITYKENNFYLFRCEVFLVIAHVVLYLATITSFMV